MASTTTQILRGQIFVGCGLGMTACARVRRLPWEDALLWCCTWSPSARRVTSTEAQLTVGVRCCVPDASVKKMMLVSMSTGRQVIAVG